MSDYQIDIQNELERDDIDVEQLRRIIAYVLEAFEVASAAVTVMIVGHEEIRCLKNEYFGMDITTDVISFDLSDETSEDNSQVQLPREYDIVINAEMAQQQAEARGGVFMAELSLYVVHGLLHQLGYDDQDDAAAREMHEKEDLLLCELGFGNVFFGKE